MMKEAYPDQQRWNELKTACKERAGWQCEYVYPNKKRCGMREDEIRKRSAGLDTPMLCICTLRIWTTRIQAIRRLH
jgi:hypothetical protein